MACLWFVGCTGVYEMIGLFIIILSIIFMIVGSLVIVKLDSKIKYFYIFITLPTLIIFSVGVFIANEESNEYTIIESNKIITQIQNMNCHDLGDLIIKNKIARNNTSIMLDKFVQDGCKFDVSNDIIEGLK